ncbi:ATP-binding cassette sub-family C member 4 [Tribolium castaneum]|uniref:Putative multidrug resistance-associated protein lethal(2)03659-like Protein n=1 Tax=Tribolium castaneum TaxID=7070 RepID=A0A139WGP5_TRICA|nr:PREDICTED: multidrug resistance-associated protein 4-like [Tribolium castaneum]KYB27064.1 putative multidrug resistance-associated protein lethal(2)03659-like Protein [Tribolium castaneum]|eukprot:XP_008194698.1 PREDICTED: multidrug resistance-associated protein 4-like [Tribolium castaneum]
MEDIEQSKIRKTHLKPHPKASANFLSHFFFCWELPLFVKGWKKELTEDDLYEPLDEYNSTILGDKIEELWRRETTTNKKPSLLKVLIKLFGLEYGLYGLFYLPAELAVALLQPHFLRKLLEFYTPDGNITLRKAYFYALGLTIFCFVRVFAFHWFAFQTAVLGMKIRIACSSLVYRSSLQLTKTTFDKITVGQIVNLLSNDVSRFNQFGPFLHSLWIGPVELILGGYFIDKQLGHAALSGITILIFCLLLQLFVLKKLSKFRRQVAEKTDYRIRLMNDIISGIQAIKFYTWEKPFETLVQLARNSEITKITNANNFRLFNNTFKIYLSKFSVYLCILVVVLTKKNLTPQYLFALTSLYESFKLTITIFIPFGVVMLSETLISVQRIEEFLLHDFTPCVKKTPLESIFTTLANLEKQTPKIALDKVTIKLNQSEILTGVSFNATPGQFIAIIGRAGSGKTTLLETVLREITPTSGTATITGLVSYAPQEPWIFSSSIRQNIVFGEVYDARRYHQVVKACALEPDFALLPHGDQTLVGERGVMLSGGQKARINLARAVYKTSDFYLFDDPLSAVDTHVGKWIYDECFLRLLGGKGIILVTHQTQFLHNVDKIYVVEDGKVKCQELQNVKIEPTKVVHDTILKQHDLQNEVKEHRSRGNTDAKIYSCYCKSAGSNYLTFGVLLLFALGQLFGSLGDFFVTVWVNFEKSGFLARIDCLYIYTGLVVLMILVIHLASLCFSFYCMNASKVLHQNMLAKIIKSPIKFFNQHSSGRILNRFSKDIGCIDELLPTSLMNIITAIFTGTAIIIIIIVLNYWMIFPTVVLLLFTVLLSILFQPSNRNIKRTEGTTQSFIFSHTSATLQGLQVIKSSNCQKQLISEFDNHQNFHTSAFYLFTAMFSAFGFWADIFAGLYTAIVIWSFFLLEKTHAGDVGLAITQCIGLVGMIQYGMKTWSELDAYMTSVERVIDYSELEPEPDDGNHQPDFWPASGTLTFDSVTLKYKPEDPPVLSNVSFRVNSGEKIGIIGRTGAGKSSLISVLFRLFPFDGTVKIDNIDTKTLPLDTLRSKISIIPQEPVLFMGTLRKNLDPFDQFTDEALWSALDDLGLKPTVSVLPRGLHNEVSERGANFSVGQRQLLCLVRALLRNSKIIVLDEATANVDAETDDLIQKTIRRKFRECTVLTIAHRLNTVIDSDKILVMDAGIVVEFDRPERLLQNPESFLSKSLNSAVSTALQK